MEMTISIADDIAAKLKERAAVSGQTVPAYTAQLVEETICKPRRLTVDEVLAPFRK